MGMCKPAMRFGGAAVVLALGVLALIHGGEASYLTGTKV